jgi:SAM-dependent methyltransferase
MSRDQAALFDHLAAGDTLYHYSDQALATLSDLVPPAERTLDVGCGDGAIGASFKSRWVAGIDISSRCAGLARGRGLRATAGDALELPFASGVFDTVSCIDVLHHLGQRWEPIFDELDRVLAPNGTLVIVEPDARNAFVRWTQAPGSPIRVAPYEDEPAIDPSDLLPHLTERGYECDCRALKIEGEQVVRSVFPMWQRLLKAPFVLALASVYRERPNKFVIIARKRSV